MPDNPDGTRIRRFQNAATEFPLVVDMPDLLQSFETHRKPEKNWSLDYGVDDDTGRSRQWLRSRLCAVHLEDVCGDVHCGVIIYVLELEARVADGYLKPIYELGYGFLAPTVEKSFASQWRNIVWISDEFLIGFG
jgi:hypothetical protein